MTNCADTEVPDYVIFEDIVVSTGEYKPLGFEFEDDPSIRAGATISSAGSFSASPSGLTIGSSSISGTKVSAFFTMPAAGSGDAEYCIKVSVTLSTGAILRGCGRLIVKDC